MHPRLNQLADRVTNRDVYIRSGMSGSVLQHNYKHGYRGAG